MNDPAATLAPQAWETLCEVRLRGTLHRPDPVHTGELELMGYVVRRGDLVAITDAGRIAHAERARLAPGSPEEAAARDVYQRFGPLNARLLKLCTDWQLRPGGIPNDHSDPDYDTGVIDRLGAQHERAERVLDSFAALEPRLGLYKERLDSAYDQALAGEHEWVSGARIDSYHTVWFELHEDLLRMLGREREEAP
jgi:hypothetical protein